MKMDELKQEFIQWWQDEKIVSVPVRTKEHLKAWKFKNVIDSSSKTHGTYCDVYQTYYQEDGSIVAIKHTNYSDYDKMTALWQEYKIHKAVYDLYIKEGKEPKVIKPLWIKKIAFNNGVHCPSLCMGLEKIDETMYDYLRRNKTDTVDSVRWKHEIITELKRLNLQYKFSHRDCHINNIALCNNNWKLFDFGMAILGDLFPFFCPDYSTSFYGNEKNLPTNIFDERILRFSWSGHGLKDQWVNYELKKIAASPSQFWTPSMPVVLKNYKAAQNGKYSFTDENGNIGVEIELVEKQQCIKLKTTPKSNYKNSTTVKKTIIFKKTAVLPDITHIFIHYYVPLLP